MMHRFVYHQRGMTGIGWLMVLMVLGFFVFLILKIGPTYMEHYSIRSVLHSFDADTSLAKKSPRMLRQMIRNRLKINSVYDFDMHNLKIKKRPDRFDIDLSYDVRKPLVGNIDVLISFKDKVSIPITR